MAVDALLVNAVVVFVNFVVTVVDACGAVVEANLVKTCNGRAFLVARLDSACVATWNA